MKEGFVQIYTGNGKGKTTAALGLTLRALGAGLRVYIGQFIKGMQYAEIHTLDRLKTIFINQIEYEQYGRGCFIWREPEPEDTAAAHEGLEKARTVMRSGSFDVVILDEINVALHLGLLQKEEVLSLLESRPPNVELVLTGRYAPDFLIERADLVTEMKEIKHYYTHGIMARDGIER
ncbi:MAG: cob(I)yrinic acid a,c-diamide adenosyltransferase [Anaerolineales bacterium]|uniref:cob(I)yrinic acid a,c-diamide adenosyltransferase n=1 Tax=Rectinema subterraneum TaxID=2653714 RepID=UPI003C7C50CA